MGHALTGSDILARLADTQDLPGTHEIFDWIRECYDVDHIVYHALNVRGLTQAGPFLRLTYPESWITRYFERNYFNIDPVVEEGSRAFMPFNWNDLDWSSRQRQEFAKDARAHTIGTSGLSVPIRGPDGQHALFSVSTSHDPRDWSQRLVEHGRELHIIAHYLHHAVIATEGAVVPEFVNLSERERNVLQWSAAGKTAAEIASILGIAERTVRVYIDTSRHKLNSANRTHAVARALSLGLIHPPD